MKCTLVFYIIALLQFERSLCNNEEDNWISPNAWDTYSESPDCAKCDVNQKHCSASKEDVAFIFYKKFIANLFSRKKLQYDEVSEIYQRCLLFSISKMQLDKLENLNDPRDLDTVLTEIFTNARIPKECSGNGGFANFTGQGQRSFMSLIWEIIKDTFLLVSKTSEGQFLLIVAAIAMFIWYVHRRYRIGIIIVTLACMLVFGFFHTYIECNRKLEAEKMLKLYDIDNNERPPRWYDSMLSWFGSADPAKEAQKDNIRKFAKVDLKFCRPDHVLIMYGNELFLKQLEMLMEKCVDTFKVMKENLPFPLNYIACLMVVVMICYMTKLTFQYILSPRAWASLYNGHNFKSNHPPQPSEPITSGDRLSGDNLSTLLKLLKTSKESRRNSASNNAVSGVQEVTEQIEMSTESTDTDKTPLAALPQTSNKSAESKSDSNIKDETVKDLKET